MKTDRQELLLCLFNIRAPWARSWTGDNERGGGKGEEHTDTYIREGYRVRQKEGSFEQAPGLSRGRGSDVAMTLPSVQQTDRENEPETEMKVGGGWENWRGRFSA